MYTEAELFSALRAADAAGDTEAAAAIARKIQAARQQPAPAKPAEAPQPSAEDLRTKAIYDTEADNSFLQNVAIGAGSAVDDVRLGSKQLLAQMMGDEEQYKQLQAEVAKKRERMAPVSESAGGMIGNVAGNIGMAALPGGAIAKGAQLLPKAALLTTIGGEAALGATTGALQPTVEGESRADNAKTGAALGALIPMGGALLRTKPVQAAADKVLDWTPFFYGARRRARNEAAKEIVDAEAATIKAQNRAAQQGFVESEKAAADAAKRAAAEQTERLRVAEQLRADAINVERKQLLQGGREDLARRAGWTKVPANKIEFNNEVERIGAEYGALIQPVQMEVDTVVPALARGAATPGLRADDARQLAGWAQRIEESANVNGRVGGEQYKVIRSEITDAMTDANSTYRAQLRNALGELDAKFEAAIPPEVREQVIQKRGQYALGKKLDRADWHPKKGLDLESVRRTLDTKGRDRTGTQQMLIDLQARLPEKARPAKVKAVSPELPPPGVPPEMQEVPRFVGEASDYMKVAAINAALLGATKGGAMALPPAAIAIKGANKPVVARNVANLLRGGTISISPELAPYFYGDEQ